MSRRCYAIVDVERVPARRAVAPRDLPRLPRRRRPAGCSCAPRRSAAGAFLELATPPCVRRPRAGATLIVNDRADVALLAGAPGVHVGQDDLTAGRCAPRARRRRDRRPLDAHAGAGRGGAGEPISYLAFGPVFGPRPRTPATRGRLGAGRARPPRRPRRRRLPSSRSAASRWPRAAARARAGRERRRGHRRSARRAIRKRASGAYSVGPRPELPL